MGIMNIGAAVSFIEIQPWVFFIVLIAFLLPFIVLYFHLNERANLIDDFNKNKELICNMSSLKIDVSKADNWSVDKNSFFKGSTSIPVTKCEIKD